MCAWAPFATCMSPTSSAASPPPRKRQASAPKAYRNYKQLLEDKSIDAVLIATPEHWHAQMVLDALAAGKDVYVEKPLCRTPEEGVALVEAEKKTKQIIQAGMQRRSYDLYLDGRKIVADGTLGNVRMVRSWWLNNYVGNGGARTAKLDGPLDWEQWQGPIKKRIPPDPFIFRNWRFIGDYAGGIVADQGAHVFDGIHLLMNASYPLAVTAAAGKPHRAGYDTPESVVVTAEYPEDFIGVFQVNYAAMRYKLRNDQMNHLDGDKARMDIGREDCRVFKEGAEETPAIEKRSRERLRLGDGPARSELPRVHQDAPDAHCAHETRFPGGAGGADGQHVAETGPALEVECQAEQGGGVTPRSFRLLVLLAPLTLGAARHGGPRAMGAATTLSPKRAARVHPSPCRSGRAGSSRRVPPAVEAVSQ